MKAMTTFAALASGLLMSSSLAKTTEPGLVNASNEGEVLPLSYAAQQPATPPPAAQPAGAPTLNDRVAAIKMSFAASQAALRTYEWVETTVVSLDGKEKSNTQNRCYYGAEGKVQKIPVVAPPPEKPARGLIGKIKESKKEELAEYMEEATALVHKYLPPDPEKIQKCVEAGKTSIEILEPSKRAKVEFKDYLQPGDSLSVEIDLSNNTILGVAVASALGKDPVSLEVKFDKFPDGTIYTAETKLDAKAKKVNVTVKNSGYRRAGG